MPEYMITGADEDFAVFEAKDDEAAIKKMHEWWDRKKNTLDEYGFELARDVGTDGTIIREITMVREPGKWRKKT